MSIGRSKLGEVRLPSPEGAIDIKTLTGPVTLPRSLAEEWGLMPKPGDSTWVFWCKACNWTELADLPGTVIGTPEVCPECGFGSGTTHEPEIVTRCDSCDAVMRDPFTLHLCPHCGGRDFTTRSGEDDRRGQAWQAAGRPLIHDDGGWLGDGEEWGARFKRKLPAQLLLPDVPTEARWALMPPGNPGKAAPKRSPLRSWQPPPLPGKSPWMDGLVRQLEIDRLRRSMGMRPRPRTIREFARPQALPADFHGFPAPCGRGGNCECGKTVLMGKERCPACGSRSTPSLPNRAPPSGIYAFHSDSQVVVDEEETEPFLVPDDPGLITAAPGQVIRCSTCGHEGTSIPGRCPACGGLEFTVRGFEPLRGLHFEAAKRRMGVDLARPGGDQSFAFETRVGDGNTPGGQSIHLAPIDPAEVRDWMREFGKRAMARSIARCPPPPHLDSLRFRLNLNDTLSPRLRRLICPSRAERGAAYLRGAPGAPEPPC